MGKRDSLLKLFRKDQAPTHALQTRALPITTSISAPAPSTPVVNEAIPVRGPEVNPALELAIAKHLNDLPEADKDAFREESKQITQDSLLSRVQAFDEQHKSTSSFRPQTKVISKFLALLNRFMAGISTAIQANPDPSSIIVGAVQLAIGLAIQFVTFFDRLTDMLECFNSYLGPLSEYAKASDGSEVMQQILASVYGDILKFCSAARHVFVDSSGGKRKWISIRTFLRVQWEPFEGQFGEIELRFRHHLDVLKHSAEALQLNALIRLEQKQNTDEREAFLGWISQVDFEKNHEDIYSMKHPGTGSWLVQTGQFRIWLSTPKSSLLWCHGKPGVGKSVLISTVLEHITSKYGLQNDIGICFAYYNYRMPEFGDPCQILSALIKQLCRKTGSIPSSLLAFKHDALHPSFASLQDIFVSVATSYDEIFLVIDALDECPMDKRHHIIGFLIEVVKSVPRAKVFITSRKESDITEAFKRDEIPMIEVMAEDVNEDIRCYVCSEVKRLREGYNGKRLYIQSDALEEKIIRTLTDKADGMFLWVNLQLENLRSVSKARKDRQIESALDHIPRGLDDTYKRMLHKIDNQEEYMKALAFKSFSWVLYAKRPLRTRELLDAIATELPLKKRHDLELDSLQVVLEACANLLVEEHDIIRPIHFSVQEFLTNPPRGAFRGLFLEHMMEVPGLIHQKLALNCIHYLQLDVLHDGPCESFYDLYKRFDKNPFLWYSARFFDHHVPVLQDISDEVLQALEALIHQNGLFLAAVFQIRKIKIPFDWHDVNTDFDKVLYPVDTSTILYSSRLFDIDVFNAKLVDGHAPKYALHSTAASGSLPATLRLLKAGCDVDEEDESGATPLYRAALEGHQEIVEKLLEKGADVNAQGGYWGNALQAASARGENAIVQLLLEKGADINTQGGYYSNALQAALARGEKAIVQLLLEKGADINAQGGYYGNALQAASDRGEKAIVQLLLEKGANINIQGGFWGNALQTASARGKKAIVQLLLEKGADINAQGGYWGNALQAALFSREEAIVQLLLEKGANINAQGGYYGNALQAASAGGEKAIVQLLLEKGANINAQGGHFGNALQAASDCGEKAIVQLLLQNGALES